MRLAPDNAYTRLTPAANSLKIVSKSFYNKYLYLSDAMEAFNKKLSTSKVKIQNKTHSLIDLVKRPNVLAKNFLKVRGEIDSFALFAEETKIKYSGYIEIEKKRIKKNKDLEDFIIGENLDYKKILNLSSEAREKLSLVRPETVGQAMRIDGVSRSDVSSLCLFLAATRSSVSRETKK